MFVSTVTLGGVLFCDPEIKQTKNGMDYAVVTLEGENDANPDITFWGEKMVAACQTFHEGQAVFIAARVNVRVNTGQSGGKWVNTSLNGFQMTPAFKDIPTPASKPTPKPEEHDDGCPF